MSGAPWGHVVDWTKAKIDSLTAYWAAPMSTPEVAKMLSHEFGETFSENAVIGKAHRLGLPKRGRPRKYKTSSPAMAAQQASVALACGTPEVAHERAMGVSSRNLPMPSRAKPSPAEPFDGIGVLSAEMKTSHCQWPLWDGALPPLDERRHCGCAVAPGRPYCAGHAAISYTKIKPRPEGVLLGFHDRASEALRAKFSSRVRA